MNRMITRTSTSTSVLIIIAAVYLFTIVRDLDVQAEAAVMRDQHVAICPWEAERPVTRVLDLHHAVWAHLPRPSTSELPSTDDVTSMPPMTPVVVPENAVLVTYKTDRSSFYEEDLIFTPTLLPASATRPSVDESFRLSAATSRP